MDIGLIGESKLPPFTIVLVQNVQFSPPECLKRLLQGNTATQSEPASLFCLLLTQTRRPLYLGSGFILMQVSQRVMRFVPLVVL